MKKLALGALVMGLLAACGGGDKNGKITPLDSSTGDTGPDVCNPLTQAGCAAGEKCTWLVDAVMPQYVGHIGCAPDGTVAVDGTCMYGAAGATGYDDCAAGNVCTAFGNPDNPGVCKQICDQQGGTPACDADHVCVTYGDLFDVGANSPAAAGVCDKACDPITDNDFDGSGTASAKTTDTCGSAANVGCYGYPRGTAPPTGWSCGGDVHFDVAQPTGLRHRVQCTTATQCLINNVLYVNACNQGYLPLLIEKTGSTTAICTALCQPTNCSTGACGTNGVNRKGIAGNACKNPDRVGTFTDAADGQSDNPAVGAFVTGGDHCRYMWYFERDDQGKFLRSPTSDKIGFCMDHSKYKYDSDNNMTADTTYPSCDQLASGHSDTLDGTKPYEYWGASDLACEDTSIAMPPAQGKQLSAETLEKMRRAAEDFPRPLYHATMHY